MGSLCIHSPSKELPCICVSKDRPGSECPPFSALFHYYSKLARVLLQASHGSLIFFMTWKARQHGRGKVQTVQNVNRIKAGTYKAEDRKIERE